MFARGDEVITVPELWHDGINIGERLATIIKTDGHIYIAVHDYPNNPVKIFRWEISLLENNYIRNFSDSEIDSMLNEFFPD